ncbi:uncharacterized protein LOC135839944 [Planococcus citri]|uniref:uncharacterized protein LOC135839944 n=1 Tax=Planococcus citri TaxID=170843 RepID=UPI0031F75E5A
MTEKIIWIVFTLHLIPNLSECTKLSGMLSDRRMNLNVLKTFDRFFYLRYNDAFFIRNTEKTITDEYLMSLYTEEFEMTDSLKKDLRMHAIYLENTAWYTTSITELFSILYTKYLAANHIISLANCRIYYTYGDANVERATRCKKIAKYLHAFVEIALGKYITRTEEFLSNVLAVRDKNENPRPYENLFYGFYQYFTHVTSVMVEENYRPEIPDNKDELLKILLLRETKFEQTTRLTFKYFFRNVFFDTPLKDFNSLLKKAEEEKMVLNSKKFTNIRNETIKFWGIVDNLIQKIEEGDLIAPTLIDKEREYSIESDEDDSSEPNKRVAAKSNVAEMIRKLEIRKLAVRGVKLSGLKKEAENEVLFQFFIEAVYKAYEPVGQKLKFVSVEAEKLSNLEIHLKSYTSMGEVISPQEFSYEVQDIMSSAEVYNSAADKSFNSMSAESYKTVVSTAVSSISKQEMDASRVKQVAEIRRLIAEKTSAAAAGGRSSNMNYSKPGDLSHLARYMASSNQANNSRMIAEKSMRSSEGGDSDYGDVSQNLSRSSAMRDNSKVYYKNNIPKRNRVTFSSSQAIAA